MPLSVVFTVRAVRECEVPAQTGRAVWVWALGLLGRHAPGAVARIHDDRGVKPVTVSGLRGAFRPAGRPGWRGVEEGAELWLRVSALCPELEAALEAAGNAAGDVIELAGAPFRVESVAWEGGAHPWAGRVGYEELYDGALRAEPPERVALQFASPTAFHSGGANVPLPVPRLVFLNLIEKWNRFGPIDLGNLADALAGGVRLQAYRLQTRAVHFGRFREIGFVGAAIFDLRGLRDPLLRRVTGALADFALYAGVGAKGTYGMGQARRLELREAEARCSGLGREAALHG